MTSAAWVHNPRPTWVWKEDAAGEQGSRAHWWWCFCTTSASLWSRVRVANPCPSPHQG